MFWTRHKHLMIVCVIFMMCPRKIRLETSTEDTETSPKNKDIGKPKPLNLGEEDEIIEKAKINEDYSPVENANIDSPRQDQGFDLTDSEIARFKIWAHGVIPYFIDDFSFDKVLRDRIRKFLDNYNAMTGIQFIELPRPPDDAEKTRWVFIINRLGQLDCVDHPTTSFTNQGVQKLVLGYDCLRDAGDIASAILSLVGVPPQHNAPNRDDYINIVNDNIIPDKKHLFSKLADSEWLFHDLPYDFSSASHYDFHAYTVNGIATIEPMKAVNALVGEARGLSDNDIKKIKMLYSYIINKKSAFKKAQCSKLFKPGAKLSKYTPNELEIKPREKPYQYLGTNGNQVT